MSTDDESSIATFLAAVRADFGDTSAFIIQQLFDHLGQLATLGCFFVLSDRVLEKDKKNVEHELKESQLFESGEGTVGGEQNKEQPVKKPTIFTFTTKKDPNNPPARKPSFNPTLMQALINDENWPRIFKSFEVTYFIDTTRKYWEFSKTSSNEMETESPASPVEIKVDENRGFVCGTVGAKKRRANTKDAHDIRLEQSER